MPENRLRFDATVQELDGIIASLEKDRFDLLSENKEAMALGREKRDDVEIVERSSRINSLSSDLTAKRAEREGVLSQALDAGGPHPTLIALDNFFKGGHEAMSDEEVDKHAVLPDGVPKASGKNSDVFYLPLEVLAYPEARRAIRAAAPSTGPGGPADASNLGQSVIETGVGMLGHRHVSFGNVDAVAQSIQRSNGNPLRMPQIDDTENTAEQPMAQGHAAGREDVDNFTGVLLNPSDINSKYALVQLQAEQDYSGIGAITSMMLVRRVARRANALFTNGAGTGLPIPFGVTRAPHADVIRDSTGANIQGVNPTAKDITEADLLALMGLDDLQPYIDGSELNMDGVPVMGTGCRWMMARQTVLRLVNIIGTDSGKFWWQDRKQGIPSMLYGFPITINNDMPRPTARGNVVILFGDFWNYAVLKVGGIAIYRDVDATTRRSMQAQYMAHARCDGAPVYGLKTPSTTRADLRTVAWGGIKLAQ